MLRQPQERNRRTSQKWRPENVDVHFKIFSNGIFFCLSSMELHVNDKPWQYTKDYWFFSFCFIFQMFCCIFIEIIQRSFSLREIFILKVVLEEVVYHRRAALLSVSIYTKWTTVERHCDLLGHFMAQLFFHSCHGETATKHFPLLWTVNQLNWIKVYFQCRISIYFTN